MIRTPFLAEKGEIKDVHEDVALELEKHGVAEFVAEEDASEEEGETPHKTSPPKHSKSKHAGGKH
jgi:hypothetical protein